MANQWYEKVKELELQKQDIEQEKEYTSSQEKLDFLDEQIQDLEHSIKIVKGYE